MYTCEASVSLFSSYFLVCLVVVVVFCLFVYIYIYTHVYVYVYVCICICICVCVCVYVRICIYIYIYMIAYSRVVLLGVLLVYCLYTCEARSARAEAPLEATPYSIVSVKYNISIV